VKTVFRPQFWVDLADGVAYLAENASPEIARRWHAEVMATVSGLEHWPNMGRLRRDLSPPDIRSLVLPRYPRYLLFYRCDTDTVEVLRIKHGMMDLPRLFGEGKAPLP
jgi:plasmid stabilization system protein ParE